MQTIKDYVKIRKELIKQQINLLNQKPKLVIIQVGSVESSNRYVKHKLLDCTEVNLPAELIQLEDTISEQELLDLMEKLNQDSSVTGYIVQLPLPKHISEAKVIEAINPLKDVDGFSKLALVNPGTPQGIIDYLDAQNFDYADKCAVVIGRSHIVGAPLAKLLLAKNCNVTVLHSKTSEENKRLYLKHADLICTAAGKLHLIDSSYELKPTATIIDFGMNFDENNKLCGDCDSNLLVAFQSPCPGGTGLTTRIALITNLLKLYKIQKDLKKA